MALALVGDRPLPTSLLVVDDGEARRALLAAMLAAEEWEIATAGSVPEALGQLVRRDFAVVLLDSEMPGGLEVVTLMRERVRTRATPILFVVRSAEVPAVCKGRAVPAVDYLREPVDSDILYARVRNLVDLHRKTEEVRRQAELLREAERERLELELTRLRLGAERRYRRLAEAMPQIVWTADSEGIVDYCNQRWFEYTGLRAERNARTWGAALHPDDVERCFFGWDEARRAGREYETEVRLRRASDGAFRWHLMRARPESGVGAAPAAWLGTFTDVDDAKRILEERTRLFREAREAVAARDEFLSIASHELKTPITSLRLQNELLLRGARQAAANPSDRQIGMHEAVGRQLDRLGRLVDELLDVSRITAGRLELERERCDLAELAREAVARSTLDRAKGGAVELRAEAPVRGQWDRLRIDQVVTNLLSNAIKYGGGQPVEVTVGASDGRASLVVRDRGIGIAPEDRERIFERFERVTGTRAPGLGLGLYIVRQIVQAHGGSIRVESGPGEGSTFTVELPLEAAP